MFRSFVALAVFVAVSYAAAIPGFFFNADAWYQTLRKPALTPPGWVFGVVWTVLYALMGVSAWLVWRRGGISANALPLALFAVQLGLNALWTWVFFGLHRPGLALAELGVLWLAILATTIAFWRRDTAAGALFVPYLSWVSFAAYLNFAFWRTNR